MKLELDRQVLERAERRREDEEEKRQQHRLLLESLEEAELAESARKESLSRRIAEQCKENARILKSISIERQRSQKDQIKKSRDLIH